MEKEILFCENFKKYRKKKGVSQKEFGRLLFEATGKQLTLTSISNYETGLHLPPPQILPVVAEILGVSIDALFGTENGPTSENQAPSYIDEHRKELLRLEREVAALLNADTGSAEKEQEPVKRYCASLLEIIRDQQNELQSGHAQLASVREMIANFRGKR